MAKSKISLTALSDTFGVSLATRRTLSEQVERFWNVVRVRVHRMAAPNRTPMVECGVARNLHWHVG